MITTYNDLYLDIRKLFIDADITSANLEAGELVRGVLGKSRGEFLRDKQLYATSEMRERVFDLAKRRLNGEPLAYLLEEWDFYGLTLKVTRDVLIPRCDTETLADYAIKQAPPDEFRFLDLCTGSGCVGIAIAVSCSKSHGILADFSQPAIEIAKENIRKYKLSGRLTCVAADVRENADLRLGMFDMIVSNPPYITQAEMIELDSSVSDFEPHMALYGGEDGLDFYRAILKNWLVLLKPGGLIAFECGYTQAEALKKLMRRYHLTQIRKTKDTAGIYRVVFGIKTIKDKAAESL